ncbi:TetR/AcrR family transcriptional regulator, partial [Streptomyces sp. NPDC050743]
FRTLAHRHPELLAYSFSHQPDFIQPDDPFWTALTAIVAAAGVPQSEVSEIAALMIAVVIGGLTAELNGALHQWSTLKPHGPEAGEDGATDAHPGSTDAAVKGPDQDHMFRLVMDTLITGLESRLTAGRDGWHAGHVSQSA